MLTTDYRLLGIDFMSRESQSPENSCTSHMVVVQIPDDFAFFRHILLHCQQTMLSVQSSMCT